MALLCIETSCDETSIAIYEKDAWDSPEKDLKHYLKADIISSQTKLHEAYGGVVPELAAREHLKNLPLLVEAACKDANCTLDDITHIAATQGPGLNGCLLVGLTYAKGLAVGRSIPLLLANHIEGHVFAAHLAENAASLTYPMLALIVSGGHTELVFSESFRRYEIIARTRDDAAGEAFDKTATLLGLPYPGGPALSKRAALGDSTQFRFPVAVANDPKSFSFSGLKTAVARKVEALGASSMSDEVIVNNLSASIERAIVDALLEKAVTACKRLRPKSFVLTGGVAANGLLRRELSSELQKLGIACLIPPPRWCTDNAAMIGALAVSIMREGKAFDGDESLSAPSRPRWPLEILDSELQVHSS